MRHTKWHVGIVRWFDNSSGRGVLESEGGECYSVHYSAIESKKKWKTLKAKRKVKFQILDDPDYRVVKKVKEAVA